MGKTYSRGERILFHIVDFCLQATSSLFLGLAYIVFAFALFCVATAVYARCGFNDSTVMGHFLWLGGMLVFYAASPLLALWCATIFLHQGWRVLWQARGVFDEKRLHPAFVFLLFVTTGTSSYGASESMHGRWSDLPVRVAERMQIHPGKAVGEIRRGLNYGPAPIQTTQARHIDGAGKRMDRPTQGI